MEILFASCSTRKNKLNSDAIKILNECGVPLLKHITQRLRLDLLIVSLCTTVLLNRESEVMTPDRIGGS